MTEAMIVDSRARSTGRLIIMWLPRIVVALLFLYVGLDKFAGRRVWVRVFDTIGVGQWFRYVTGLLQMSGAILVLVPRTFRIGIGILACTMLGACIAWLTVLHGPENVVIPGALLITLVVIGVFSRQA